MNRRVNEVLSKGFVRHSLGPCAVPALLTYKKDDFWKFCVDSRAISKITVKYKFLFMRLEDMLDCLGGSSCFSKIDVRSGYHQVCIRLGDETKMAYLNGAMPFGLSNAPTTVMRLITHVLQTLLGKFCWYILMISWCIASLKESTLSILGNFSVLLVAKLFPDLKKCVFL